MDKCTSDNDDFSLYSPKTQGQSRGEGLPLLSHILASGVWSDLTNLENTFRPCRVSIWDNQMFIKLI